VQWLVEIAQKVDQVPKGVALDRWISRRRQRLELRDDRVDDAVAFRTVAPIVANVSGENEREVDEVPACRGRIERPLVVCPCRSVGDRIVDDRRAGSA
jgi:hypothetical protein